jgi:RNA polymerase sigma-70 factor, ECF subfamily
MSATTGERANKRTGGNAPDKDEFEKLAAAHLAELRLHCYRMMGSLSDAEDMVQDTLVRAWTGLGTFEGKSSYRHWLYTIATNACLNALERRGPRGLPRFMTAPSSPDAVPKPTDTDDPWLEPFPDSQLGETAQGPEAQVTIRESVALAFVAAIQHLPPLQRATLLLRDVIGWSAVEVAEILETTVPAANSALQRAREKLQQRRGASDRPAPMSAALERELTQRYVQAWEKADVPALVALLKEDAAYSMPPLPMWIEGREVISTFLETAVFASRGKFRLLPTRANGCPAVAIYSRAGAEEDWMPVSIQVLEWNGELISAIETFLVPSLVGRFGLPRLLEADDLPS